MKDIDKMNLAELANKLCDLREGDTVGLLRIADRMDKLHELTRWIPGSERLPTESDAQENGYVEFWNTKYAMSYYYKYDSLRELYDELELTHWRKITPPEDK
jgi:hypothetical protein